MIFKLNDITLGIIDTFPKGVSKDTLTKFADERFKEILSLFEIDSISYEQDKTLKYNGQLKE